MMLRLLRQRHLGSIFPTKTKTLVLSQRCSTGSPPPQWTETVDYLDESGSVISTSPGARPVIPSQDSTFLAGSLPLPISRPVAAARLASLALRHPWGPDLLSRLDSLPSPPSMSLLLSAISSLPSSDPTPSLSLFNWARRQSWCNPLQSEPLFNLVLRRLERSAYSEHVLKLFDEMLSLGDKDQDVLSHLSPSLNLAIQLLADASLLEPSFACFKKLRDRNFTQFTTHTFNSMITLFLTKGLPYKAFEIYESMETSRCSLDSGTYELMIPALAKSGRLDSALKLFTDMKLKVDNKAKPFLGTSKTLSPPILSLYLMRASFRTLRFTTSTAASATTSSIIRPILSLPLRLFSAEAASDSDSPTNADFDSSEYTLPSTPSPSESKARFDPYYRARADEALFGKKMQSPLREEEERERATRLARSLLEAALEPPDNEEEEEDMVVREEDQMSLSVGIIGAPNAGKSSLTNFMV